MPPRRSAEDGRRQAELARAYGRYQELLAANGCIDFGDQVALALRLVRDVGRRARATIAGRYRYILVDEFQDTNRAQAELVGLLAEPHRNVTVVGDDDQAIYAFRGAAIDNILDFEARYPGARTVVLRRNYRSLAPVLDAAYRLIRFNDPDRLEVRTGLVEAAARPSGSIPRRRRSALEAFATGSEEADWIAVGHRAGGSPPAPRRATTRSSSARTATPTPILRALNMAGLPWRFSGASGLYARPEVRLLMAFLRVVADPRVERRPVRPRCLGGLRARRRGPHRDRQLGPASQSLGAGGARGARSAARDPARLARDSRRGASPARPTSSGYVAMAHERPAGEVLYAFLRDSGMLARLAATPTTAAEEGLGNVARFFDIIRAQSALLADDRASFVAQHLQTLIEAGDDPATADLDPDADAVAVLTVHKAKGLEFPVVYLPGLVRRAVPGQRSGRGAGAAGRARDAASRRPPSARSPRSDGCSTWR